MNAEHLKRARDLIEPLRNHALSETDQALLSVIDALTDAPAAAATPPPPAAPDGSSQVGAT